jgi:hypothetical protein
VFKKTARMNSQTSRSFLYYYNLIFDQLPLLELSLKIEVYMAVNGFDCMIVGSFWQIYVYKFGIASQ